MRMWWQKFEYKNLSLLGASLIVAFILFRNESLHYFLLHLGGLGYFGAFIAGILFVSTFTVASSVVILLVLAETLSPIGIGIIAGAGAVLGDFIVFKSIRNKNIVDEVKHLFSFFQSEKLSHLIRTKYFSWTLPVVGALLIASPLPDEIGISLMGISKLETYRFLILSFLLNSLGIILVLMVSTVVKP